MKVYTFKSLFAKLLLKNGQKKHRNKRYFCPLLKENTAEHPKGQDL